MISSNPLNSNTDIMTLLNLVLFLSLLLLLLVELLLVLLYGIGDLLEFKITVWNDELSFE